jgi:IS1 family transposase
MNKLPDATRAKIVHHIAEGCSIRGTGRLVGVSKDTVAKLVVDIGAACAKYLDEIMYDLPCKRIQIDEIWAFVWQKERNVAPEFKGVLGFGDCYTWVSMDPDTKLAVNFLVGRRDTEFADAFVADLAPRLRNSVQISSDGHKPYVAAIEKAFASKVDYGQVVKRYGGTRIYQDGSTKKCRSSECSSIEKQTISGNPDPAHISTSLIERQNKTMRMSLRRYTRKTDAFSKKLWNHHCATALYFMYYNFARIHQTLRCTPAQEAGLSKHVWSLEEIAALAPIVAPKIRGAYRKQDAA